MNFFGTNIKFLREELGLTQDEMQAHLNIKGKTLSNYERGNTEPPIDVVLYISKFYGFLVDDLLMKDLRLETHLIQKWKDQNIRLNSHLKPHLLSHPIGKKANYQQQETLSIAADEGPVMEYGKANDQLSSIIAELATIRAFMAKQEARITSLEDKFNKGH